MDPIFRPVTDGEKFWRIVKKEFLRDNGDGTYDYFGNLNLFDFYFKSMKDFPKIRKVRGNFYCAYNQLTTLDGGPRNVSKSYNCFDNNLESLSGGPNRTGDNFNCNNNHIVSLEGGPKWVGWNYVCSDNPLETLKGMAKYIGQNLILNNCPIADDIKLLETELYKYAGLIKEKILTSHGGYIWLHDRKKLKRI